MEQVVTSSAVFKITARMMVSIKVSSYQEFTIELCKEFFSITVAILSTPVQLHISISPTCLVCYLSNLSCNLTGNLPD
jgi:hypothetical protein